MSDKLLNIDVTPAAEGFGRIKYIPSVAIPSVGLYRRLEFQLSLDVVTGIGTR